jgi:hypothetical protein
VRCSLAQPNQLPIDDLHIDFNERLWSITQRIYMKDGWYQQDPALEGGDFRYTRSETDLHDRGDQVQKASAILMGKVKKR